MGRLELNELTNRLCFRRERRAVVAFSPIDKGANVVVISFQCRGSIGSLEFCES